MQQSDAPTLLAQQGSRTFSLRAHWSYIGFVLWMLLKQCVALLASGITATVVMLPATAGALLIISPWIFLKRGRRWMLRAVLLNAIVTLILFADMLYFRQFGDLVSVASLRFIPQLGTVSDSVFALMNWSDLLMWVDVPLMVLLALLPTHASDRWVSRLESGGMKLRTASMLTAVGALMIGLIVLFDPMLSAKYYGHSIVASRMGLLNYHVFDIGNYLGRLTVHAAPSGESVKRVDDWFSAHRSPSPAGAPGFGVAKGKNVIMVQVESLQAFALGLRVNGQEVLPNLNRLARESMNFTDFYSETGQGVTADADLAGNCSLFPTRTGAVYYDYPANDYRCMPEVLHDQGYTAVALQGMPPDFWNLATAYPSVGFSKYYNMKDGFVPDEQLGLGLSDASFLRQTAAHLKELPQPYYAFPVTLTSHAPFNFPGLPHELSLGDLEGTEAGHYLHAVHYTDKALGQFFDQLKHDGMLDNAVVLVYGDHAGIFRHNSGMSRLLGINPADEVGWTRTEKRIPMLIRLPGGAMAQEMSHAAGQVDIAPTLAGLLGINVNESRAFFMGRNLLDQPRGIIPFYTGSAMSDDLLFSSKDVNPAMGKCFLRATGAEVPIQTCVPLAEQAAEQLEISRLIVTRNLIPHLHHD